MDVSMIVTDHDLKENKRTRIARQRETESHTLTVTPTPITNISDVELFANRITPIDRIGIPAYNLNVLFLFVGFDYVSLNSEIKCIIFFFNNFLNSSKVDYFFVSHNFEINKVESISTFTSSLYHSEPNLR